MHQKKNNLKKLYYEIYLPKNYKEKKTDSIFILHTLNEYSGRYKELANILVSNLEFSIVLIDLPGHGKSFYPKQIHGLIDSYKELIEYLKLFYNFLKNEINFNDIRNFIFFFIKIILCYRFNWI